MYWKHFNNFFLENTNEKDTSKLPQTPDKGPVMLLNEMFNNVKFEESGEIGHQFAKFKMFVHVDGKKFEGVGKFRKDLNC